MITAIHRKKLISILVMLLTLSGMSFSVIGEASSHSISELADAQVLHHHDHQHEHDTADEQADTHIHHDASNHTHESPYHLNLCLLSVQPLSRRESFPFAGDFPRRSTERLERPPKATLTI